MKIALSLLALLLAIAIFGGSDIDRYWIGGSLVLAIAMGCERIFKND